MKTTQSAPNSSADPEFLKIGPCVVPVIYKDLSTNTDIVFGDYKRFPTPVIQINPNLEPAEKASTKLHEALHAISGFYGLRLNEQAVRTLEMALVGLLRENPRFTAELVSGG